MAAVANTKCSDNTDGINLREGQSNGRGVKSLFEWAVCVDTELRSTRDIELVWDWDCLGFILYEIMYVGVPNLTHPNFIQLKLLLYKYVCACVCVF